MTKCLHFSIINKHVLHSLHKSVRPLLLETIYFFTKCKFKVVSKIDACKYSWKTIFDHPCLTAFDVVAVPAVRNKMGDNFNAWLTKRYVFLYN